MIEALSACNGHDFIGYGEDDACERAATKIKELCVAPKAAVHFLLGGTQVNYTFIAAALRPFEAAVGAQSAHINVHETGAVENTGHKILTVPHQNGKIKAQDVEKLCHEYFVSPIKEHIVKPRMLFIALPTELGSMYCRSELEEFRQICDEYGMYLYFDGARLPYGLGSDECDFDLKFIAKTADAFYLGGTKCGALFGEALVIINDALKPFFRAYMKQNGALLAKGWLLGLQFEALLVDDLYFKLGKQATAHAMQIRRAFMEQGIELYSQSPTNQQFVLLKKEQMHRLASNHLFEDEGEIEDGRHIVRFCTSFCTKPGEVEALISDIRSL